MLESDGILGQRFEDRRSWSRYPSSSRFFRSSCVLAEHGSSRVLLWACCVIGAASIGLFFVPGAILMTIAAVRRDRTDVVRRPAAIPSRPS